MPGGAPLGDSEAAPVIGDEVTDGGIAGVPVPAAEDQGTVVIVVPVQCGRLSAVGARVGRGYRFEELQAVLLLLNRGTLPVVPALAVRRARAPFLPWRVPVAGAARFAGGRVVPAAPAVFGTGSDDVPFARAAWLARLLGGVPLAGAARFARLRDGVPLAGAVRLARPLGGVPFAGAAWLAFNARNAPRW